MAGPGVISFTRTEKYSSLVAEELKEMRDARVFSDFKISIKDESIPCHRLVLSIHSAMLKAMLTSDMAEAAKHSVKLDHIDMGVMKVILDYMYAGQVSFQVEQLSNMIIARLSRLTLNSWVRCFTGLIGFLAIDHLLEISKRMVVIDHGSL